MTRPVSLARPRCALLVVALAWALVAGCEGATRTVDARFSTPEHTIDTLLGSYGLGELSQAQIRDRLASHARFELEDRESYEACFADLGHESADEGLAGYVLGAIAAGRDALRVEIVGERARVSPRDGVEVVLRRDADDGAWRVVLAESVPAEVRARLGAIAGHAESRLRRGIPTAMP